TPSPMSTSQHRVAPRSPGRTVPPGFRPAPEPAPPAPPPTARSRTYRSRSPTRHRRGSPTRPYPPPDPAHRHRHPAIRRLAGTRRQTSDISHGRVGVTAYLGGTLRE